MLTIYPATFIKEDEGYSVFFHDLDGCYTQGDTLEEAIQMAQEVLGLFLVSLSERNIPIPSASDPTTLTCEPNEFITLITTNTERYRRNTKAIKKTLTIPQWLNEEAEAHHINFSSVLQKALKSELKIV